MYAYLDEDKNIVPVKYSSHPKVIEMWEDQEARHVGDDHIMERGCRYRVSTVFLPVDHGYGGVPVHFETMIFAVDYTASLIMWCLGWLPKTIADKIYRFSPLREYLGKQYRDVYCNRYYTWEDAKKHHDKLVEALENGGVIQDYSVYDHTGQAVEE